MHVVSVRPYERDLCLLVKQSCACKDATARQRLRHPQDPMLLCTPSAAHSMASNRKKQDPIWGCMLSCGLLGVEQALSV